MAFRPLRTRGADPLLSLVSSLGVAVAIVNTIQYLVGAENYSFPSAILGGLPSAVHVGGAPVRTVQLIILGISIVMVVALTLLVERTAGEGSAGTSGGLDPAQLLGITSTATSGVSLFLFGLLGGVAGALVGLSVSIAGPYFGIAYGLKGLAVIVLGGLGDIPGAVVGGLVLGLVEAFVPASAIAYRDAVAFALLFAMLLLRPQGLLGRAQVTKV